MQKWLSSRWLPSDCEAGWNGRCCLRRSCTVADAALYVNYLKGVELVELRRSVLFCSLMTSWRRGRRSLIQWLSSAFQTPCWSGGSLEGRYPRMCLHACSELCGTEALVPVEVRVGHQIPLDWSYRRLWAVLWVLVIVPGSFGRASYALNHWAISSTPTHFLLMKEILVHSTACCLFPLK